MILVNENMEIYADRSLWQLTLSGDDVVSTQIVVSTQNVVYTLICRLHPFFQGGDDILGGDDIIEQGGDELLGGVDIIYSP